MGPIHHTTGGEGDSATPPPHHRGGGGRSHMGSVYGTHPIWGGRGGGRAWCIYTCIDLDDFDTCPHSSH